MDNNQPEMDLFTDYFKQTKQRVDIDIGILPQKVTAMTKLTFIPKEGKSLPLSKEFLLRLNAENMYITKITLLKNNNFPNPSLSFHNYNPPFTKTYLDSLYANIEEIDSFKNVNRVEWEVRQKGNLWVVLPYNLLDSNKIKIQIEYEILENDVGIVFNHFYDEKIDIEHTVCFTPNFYFNTQMWVPCIYDLNLQIYWRLYIYTPMDYMAYCSCQIIKIHQGTNNKKLIVCFSQEPIAARNVGFIVVNDKIFNRISDPNNKNYMFVCNESKKEKVEKNLISNKLMSTLYSFYDEFFDTNETNLRSNLNSPTFIVFIPYFSINSINFNFNKFIKGKEENYFNILKFPSLYIIPDKYLYTSSIPEMMKFQLRVLSKAFITNYIGGLITESSYAEFWIICGIESWLSDLFMGKAFGTSFLKNRIYNYILKFKSLCKNGKETHPLYHNNYSHPMEVQLDPISYLKSKLVLHLLEAQVEKIFVQKALKNIINERSVKGYNISTETLIKIFRKNCGVNLKHLMNLWVYKTGMLEIELNYTYNQRTNSVDIELHQNQIAKNYYTNNPYFRIKEIDYESLEKYNKYIQIIDFRARPNRYFDVFLNLNIYQTNGIEIMRDTHSIKLENEKENYFLNFPLISKMRKMPLKKREQDFIQDLIMNTSISKIYSNEDIEKIFTQNSILWLRVETEIKSILINKIKQQHILYEYIKLFKEGDIIGQIESLNNIKKDKLNYANSLNILKTLIESNSFYKLRQYAIKVYVKIILKQKSENEYQFLIDYLDDCYNDILKNKTSLNYDIYYVMKEIIKHLCEYREDNFNQFYVLGLVTNSPIQNKIINKFLSILVSNELNTITGFNDCYIISEILVGCSKLNLQEKSLILLKKILKSLRIEKLKRSFNEITIISSIFAFLNLMVKNDFYTGKKDYTAIVNEILLEINYYANTDCENYELNVFLEYFNIFLIFYKSDGYIHFCDAIKYHVLGPEYTNLTKNVHVDMDENLSIISKIKAVSFLFEGVDFTFNTKDEKISMLSCIKDILFSPKCYLRIDCRIIMQKIYDDMFNKEILPIGAGNNNFNNVNFIHILNKNWANYAGKKYADEDWLIH